MTCGNCRREIQEDRSSCLYCGWTKAEGNAAPTAARPLPSASEPETFRAGATTWRFLGWAAVATTAGVILERRGHPEIALALFVLGPAAFAAQVLRMLAVRVTVDPEAGLLLPGGRRVPWSEIEDVGFRGARFAPDMLLVRALLAGAGVLAEEIHGIGLMGIVHLAGLALVGCLIAVTAFVSGILFPVLILLSPWEPRVVVRLRNGERRIWRDLRREADFVHRVEAGLRRESASFSSGQ
jgi:hypothetical protein